MDTARIRVNKIIDLSLQLNKNQYVELNKIYETSKLW